MNKRYLITPSLYNSYIYYVGTDFENMVIRPLK